MMKIGLWGIEEDKMGWSKKLWNMPFMFLVVIYCHSIM